jgi:hypothetical protein
MARRVMPYSDTSVGPKADDHGSTLNQLKNIIMDSVISGMHQSLSNMAANLAASMPGLGSAAMAALPEEAPTPTGHNVLTPSGTTNMGALSGVNNGVDAFGRLIELPSPTEASSVRTPATAIATSASLSSVDGEMKDGSSTYLNAIRPMPRLNSAASAVKPDLGLGALDTSNMPSSPDLYPGGGPDLYQGSVAAGAGWAPMDGPGMDDPFGGGGGPLAEPKQEKETVSMAHIELLLDEMETKAAAFAPPKGKSSGIIDLCDVPSIPSNFYICGKTLLKHQVQGINWMLLREMNGSYFRGGLLCDDVGLGKTVQLTCLVSQDKKRTLTLVILPCSVICAWQRELLMAGNIRVFMVQSHSAWGMCVQEVQMVRGEAVLVGCQLSLSALKRNRADACTSGGQRVVVISTYGMCKPVGTSNIPFAGIVWDRIVLDEAHIARSITTETCKRLLQLERNRLTSTWLLTATPVVNRIGELLTLLLICGFSRKTEEFSHLFKRYLYRHQFTSSSGEVEPAHFDQIHHLWEMLALRRTMKDISPEDQKLLEFPDADPIIEDRPVPFKSAEEEAIYLQVIKYVESEWAYVMRYFTGSKLGAAKIVLISFLRLLCVHPNLAIRAINKRRVMAKLPLWEEWTLPTSKNAEVLTHVAALKAKHENVLIFTHFGLERRYFESELAEMGYTMFSITGDHSYEDRDITVDRTRSIPTYQQLFDAALAKELATFRDHHRGIREPDEVDMMRCRRVADMEANNKWKPIALIVQIRAGGAGLNLQHFCHALIPSPDWTSVAVTQAIGRMYRFGQKRQVNVLQLHIPTVENATEQLELRMKAVQDGKQQLLDFFIKSTSTAQYED